MDEVTEILKNLDWSPLYISLKTGVAATVISFFLRIFAAGKAVKSFPQGKKSGARWDFDASYGDASYGSRLFFTVVV